MSTTDENNLSPTSYVVLGLVGALGSATSYDLKRAVQGSVGNYWAFPHSQLYAEPQRLAERGLLTDEQEPGGRRRRTFRLTEEGRAALRRWLADPHTRGLELRDEALLKLTFGAESEPTQVAELARAQQEVHRSWAEHYDELAGGLPLEGDSRFSRATLEMGRRYRRLARDFWRDVEVMAETGRMPTEDGPPQRGGTG